MLDLSIIEQVVVAPRVDAESILSPHHWGTNRCAQREGDEKKGFLHDDFCSFEDCGDQNGDCLASSFCSTKSECLKKGEEQSGGPRGMT